MKTISLKHVLEATKCNCLKDIISTKGGPFFFVKHVCLFLTDRYILLNIGRHNGVLNVTHSEPESWCAPNRSVGKCIYLYFVI